MENNNTINAIEESHMEIMLDGVSDQFAICVRHLITMPCVRSNAGEANKSLLIQSSDGNGLGSEGILIRAKRRQVSLDGSTEDLEAPKKLKMVVSSTRCDVAVDDETMADTGSFVPSSFGHVIGFLEQSHHEI